MESPRLTRRLGYFLMVGSIAVLLIVAFFAVLGLDLRDAIYYSIPEIIGIVGGSWIIARVPKSDDDRRDPSSDSTEHRES